MTETDPESPVDPEEYSNPIHLDERFNPALYILDKNDWIGRGGYGDVYKARLKEMPSTIGLPEEVAVKIVAWPINKAACKENKEWDFFKKGYKLNHVNIVKCFYVSPIKVNEMNSFEIWMELCEMSLDRFVNDTDVSIPDIRHVIKGVVVGLECLHKQHVIHRDVKPANILLKKPGRDCSNVQEMEVKLADFGIYKVVSRENTIATNTKGMGSGSYMAPEVMRSLDDDGKTRYGTSCDIWSVGVLTYFLRTKQKFSSERAILIGALDISSTIENVQEDVLKIFLKACLKEEPTERETAKQLLGNTFFTN